MKLYVAVSSLAAVAACIAFAQRGGDVSWAPKPKAPTKYTGPHKPHTKLSEVKAKNKAKNEWTEVVVDDDYLHAEYVATPEGGKLSRRFHPDTRTWWIVLDGEMKVDIEGEQPFVAKKGSIINVPAQTLYSFEATRPSLRFHVGIAGAKTLYPEDTKPPVIPGVDWIPVRLGRKGFGYSKMNKPHTLFSDVAAEGEKKNGTYRVVEDDRAVANAIYGYAKNLPPINEADRGHYHPECAEFWLIMAGQVRYKIENQPLIIADEGDVVYVPKFTFHAPRWHGDGPSCRLAMNGYPNISHLFDAKK